VKTFLKDKNFKYVISVIKDELRDLMIDHRRTLNFIFVNGRRIWCLLAPSSVKMIMVQYKIQ